MGQTNITRERDTQREKETTTENSRDRKSKTVKREIKKIKPSASAVSTSEEKRNLEKRQ